MNTLPDELVLMIMEQNGYDALMLRLTCSAWQHLTPKYSDPYRYFDVFTLKRSEKSVHKLLRYGHLFNIHFTSRSIRNICKHGDISVVPRMREVCNKLGIDEHHILYGLCRGGHLEHVKLIQYRPGSLEHIKCFTKACASGNIELVKYLKPGVLNTSEGIRKALKHGHIDIYEHVRGNLVYFAELCGRFDVVMKYKPDLVKCFVPACIRNDTKLIDYILNNANIDDNTGIHGVCIGGQMHLLKRFLNKSNTNSAIFYACQGGHVEIAKHILKIDYFSPLLHHSIEKGYTDIVSLFVNNGCEMYNGYFSIAARKDRYEILDILLKNAADSYIQNIIRETISNANTVALRFIVSRCNKELLTKCLQHLEPYEQEVYEMLLED